MLAKVIANYDALPFFLQHLHLFLLLQCGNEDSPAKWQSLKANGQACRETWQQVYVSLTHDDIDYNGRKKHKKTKVP